MPDNIATAPWLRPAARWVLPTVKDERVEDLRRALGLHRLAAAVLVHRGFDEASAAEAFLSPELDSLCDPFLLQGMDIAVERLLQAVHRREPILVYGDYDVDGTSSIVILKKTIEILGGCAEYHVPHRLTEGYGMRSEAIERAAASGIRLVVSVDTGIRANEVVRHANGLGIDVIVTDHHLPDAELPPALAVLNPNRPDCSYPFKHLCGAGVTFKLVQALLSRSNMATARQKALLDSFLKPVAIATVADIVPLTGENRVIVRRGLAGLRCVRNLGLRSLLTVSGFEQGECPTAHQVAFRVAPRINAAGRMSTARDVIELFLTEDGDRAQRLAEQLDVLNRQRQKVEAEIVEAILRQCESEIVIEDAAALVFSGEGWHPGVLGIVASRLVERFSRPVFVLSDAVQHEAEDHRCLTGSGRSIPGFHLLEALESMPELFTKFGGHKQAAGLTLPATNIEPFRTQFQQFARARLTAEDLRPQFVPDAAASFSELNDTSVKDVMALGPFGFGNPLPLFVATSAELCGPPRSIGEGKHFSLVFRQDDRTRLMKAWNFGYRQAELESARRVDLVFGIEDDPGSRKRGFAGWCMTLKDLRSAS